ncbi:hypothetical protein NC651_012689 [Populus alba x Populus x berolinensis]|nr:hypothetical protein NC651_012689 [Populus alba x Populus x berolinensis]
MILEFMLCLQREKKGEVKDSKQGSQFTTGVSPVVVASLALGLLRFRLDAAR